MTGLAADPLDPAVVRLRVGRTVLGAGFLIAPGVVATCAHVVGGATPVVDFPLLRSHDHAVEVLSQDDDLDVAILRLADAPPGALPVPARITGDVRDHRFRTFGFPHDMPDGIWVTGRLVGAQGAGRIQMAVDPDHWRIEPGFSGAPVWDAALRGVVGMVATTSARSGTTAHLVPTTALGDAWTTPDRNPYRGLRPFREKDAALFHGRDDEVEELLELLAEQDMIAIAGPSGSGKSSLVRAGLLPRLQQMGATIAELNAGDPIDSVPVAGGGTVLFLDQFEEAVAADPEAARVRLGQIIERVAALPVQTGRPAPLRVVLTLRSRSLDDLTTAETRKKLNQAVWLLEPMQRESLREAITRPAAEIGGIAFEVGLVDAILHDSPPEHGTLPLLSELLKQLWDHRHGGWLTHAAYQELGRLPGALSKHADSALATFRPAAAAQAKRLLVRLTRPDGEGGYARRSVSLGDLDPELREVAHDLAAKRLVLIQDQTVNLTHQALIERWSELRGWLAADADFLSWQAKLQQLQDAGGLLRNAPLSEAADWLRARADDIPEHQQRFIRRSAAAQRRAQNRWRTITAVSVTLTLVAAVLTAVVVGNNAELGDRLRSINAASLAQASNRATEVNPLEALQLALAAWKEKADSVDADGALLQQRLYWRGVDHVLDQEPFRDIREIHASADGRVAVLVPREPTGRLTAWWNLPDPDGARREIPVTADGEFALSPDGRRLAASGPEPGLRVWDLGRPDGDPMVLDPQLVADSPAFSANGRFLAARPDDWTPVGSPKQVRVWDLDSGQEIPNPLTYAWNGNQPVTDAYPAPDGRSLVLIEYRGRRLGGAHVYEPVVRDLATGAEIRAFPASEGANAETAVLDAGTHAVTCSDDTLVIHDSFTGAVTGQFPDPGCAIYPDATGQYLLLDNDPNGARLTHALHWRTGALLAFGNSSVPVSWGAPYDPNPVLIPGPGGAFTAVSARNGAVQVGSLPTSASGAKPPKVDPDSSSLSPDGRSLITYVYVGSGDETELTLLDERGALLNRQPLPKKPDGLAFDASGERILVVAGRTLRIYRTAGLVLEREVRMPSPAGRDGDETYRHAAASLTAAPDGRVLVGHLAVLSFWDPRTGTQTAPPVELDVPPAWESLPGGPKIALRPGNPDQLLAQTSDGLSVWDLRTRTQAHAFRLGVTDLVVSADGSVAAMTDRANNSIRLVDLIKMDEITPLIAPGPVRLIGMSGPYLFAKDVTAVQVWNWGERRMVASMKLGSQVEQQAVGRGDFVLDRLPGHQESIPLDPEFWFRDLCRISDREFTVEERNLLPEGVSDEPPCR